MSYADDLATLHIHMALPEDAGYYTLLAENTNGRIACSAHLVIEGVGAPVATHFHQQVQQKRYVVIRNLKVRFCRHMVIIKPNEFY